MNRGVGGTAGMLVVPGDMQIFSVLRRFARNGRNSHSFSGILFGVAPSTAKSRQISLTSSASRCAMRS
jgi:hypothetical protein